MGRVKRFFFTTLIGGVVVLLPISILVFLIRFGINFIGGILRPITSVIRGNSHMSQQLLDFIAFIVIILFCFLVGLIIRTQYGKTTFTFVETKYLSRIPFYVTIKDIVGQFTNSSKTPFKQVVMADVFNNGTRMTGFITDEHENGKYTIFVPTAPNPTNGYVFHVNRDQLVFLENDTQEAMRTVIGMGAGSRNLSRIKKELEQHGQEE